MSHNTITHNNGQDTEEKRNNPPQYNLRPLRPQVEEREGEELPPLTKRRVAKCQPRREMRTKCLEHRLNTLTALGSTLVVALGQNTTNVALAIPLGIPLADAEGEEAQPPQEGGDSITSEAQTKTSQRRRRDRRRCQNIIQLAQEDHELTPESHKTSCTRGLSLQ